jgi:hypothetical protein
MSEITYFYNNSSNLINKIEQFEVFGYVSDFKIQ